MLVFEEILRLNNVYFVYWLIYSRKLNNENVRCCRIWNWFPICKRNHCLIVKLFIIFGTSRVQVCFIWCFHDVWTWHCSRSQVRNGKVMGIDCMAGQVMFWQKLLDPVVLSFYFHFSLSPLLKSETTERIALHHDRQSAASISQV